MCGIAGIALAGHAPIDEQVLRQMTRTLAHRGPDGEGLWTAPGIGLGHRRLAILDLSDAAAQPMVRGDRGDALTFNGELYNFAELRNDLGCSFTSSGDAEVLLCALQRFGPDALRRIQGMFAFGYWDGRARTLLLARDRFGKKPLYYAPLGDRGRDGLVFASELRALIAHPRIRRERAIDPVALGQFLLHEYVPAPRSILANVRKLLPGDYLLWSEGKGCCVQPYYRPHFGCRTGGDPRALAQEFSRLVEEATRVRLVADVPVGVFLSGGLDSSLLAALASRIHSRIKTFSISFEEPSFDEGRYARSVARHLGTEHVEERLGAATMLELLPEALDFVDEPFSDSSLLPTMLLARVARREVKVALGGDGGDELMAGYPTFIADRLLRGMPRWPAGPASLLRSLLSRVSASDENLALGFKLKQLSQGLGARGARRHAAWLASLLPVDLAGLAGPGLPRIDPDQLWEAVDGAAAGATSGFDAATAFYLRGYLAEGVLTKVDRATMWASLEARAPLLDTRVVEFCLTLPPSLLLHGLTTKWLMREALRPLVPREIVERPKKGFGAPTARWLRGPLLPLLRETLSPARLREAGWLRPEAVTAMVDAHASGRRNLHKPLYALLVLEHWRRRFFC